MYMQAGKDEELTVESKQALCFHSNKTKVATPPISIPSAWNMACAHATPHLWLYVPVHPPAVRLHDLGNQAHELREGHQPLLVFHLVVLLLDKAEERLRSTWT